MFDTEKYNQGVRYRARKIRDNLKSSLGVFSIGQTGALLKALGSIKYKKNFGEIDGVGFTVTKGGIMTMYGVGKGVSVDSAKSNSGKIGRVKKLWFNPVIDATIPELADFVVSQKADALLNQIKLK